ncbi:hypothetical protein [Flavobacterium sp.]|uniref:DUF6630 family protein n=1 Tax=Flavobacterium sp. TaxID=239 RepID=UPI00262B0551|nr:hypothetical protein [Flavobacterium sp.]
MSFKNLKYLAEIVSFMDQKSKESSCEIYAPQFESNIFVEEILYPKWVKDWENTDEYLSQLELDIMTPIETMVQKSGLDCFEKEMIEQGSNYYYVNIFFSIKTFPKFKGVFKNEAVNIFLIPFEDDNGNEQVKIMSPIFSLGIHFNQLMDAEPLDLDTTDERQIYKLKALSEAIEVICNEFKITTELNKGNFVGFVKEDSEKLINDFIEIAHVKGFNNEEEILEFKYNWNLIQLKPEEYKEMLVDEGYFDEDAEIDTHYFTQYLLSDFLCAFDTDWKMDHEELSEFISEEIGQDFKITYEETMQKPSVIVEKIEKESNYTMLNIDTQMDSYSFFVCKKSEKDKILELARKLNFPIEDTF